MDTRKFFIAFTVATSATKLLSAQNNTKPLNNSIGISYGNGTIMKIFDQGFDEAFASWGGGKDRYTGDNVFAIDYTTSISKRIDLGAEVSYSSYNDIGRFTRYNYKHWSVLAKSRYYFKKGERWRIYGGISFGIMQINNTEVSIANPANIKKEKNYNIAFQLVMPGVEYGKGPIVPFIELGTGTNGAITGGVRFRF